MDMSSPPTEFVHGDDRGLIEHAGLLPRLRFMLVQHLGLQAALLDQEPKDFVAPKREPRHILAHRHTDVANPAVEFRLPGQAKRPKWTVVVLSPASSRAGRTAPALRVARREFVPGREADEFTTIDLPGGSGGA
eukprot:8937128-Pyramimonas_sp.AAC.1